MGGVDLRKAGAAPKLYHVLEEKQSTVSQGALFGSDHTYVIPGKKKEKDVPEYLKGVLAKNVDLDVAINPEELEGLDEEGVRQLYDEKLAEARRRADVREDLSDVVAEKAAQQKRKLLQKQEQQSKKTDSAKRAKTETFKF
mmetsp:Transcript_15810/g.28334  ORF Transcript_15810/g.28334 Transcript_15810/m.28334 type:complete len:141 (-) Transcript_15810:41-463(-)